MPERPHLRPVASTDFQRDACERFLGALFGITPHGSFVEIRFRTESGMGRAFHATDRLADVARAIADHAPRTDVYIGVLPRARQASRRTDLVDRASVIWADCDCPESVSALERLVPPSVLVASGTGDNRHAYWILDAPAPLNEIEAANRKLASILGSDVGSCDAARILRPPALNHKHSPAMPVDLLRCDPAARYRFEQIVGVVQRSPSRAERSTRPRADRVDPLLALEPTVYVELLTGQAIGRDRKVRCPFHADRTPSLHVYAEPARGWHCFGCGRGGSIYDFAEPILGYATRGSDFRRLRERLGEIFGLA